MQQYKRTLRVLEWEQRQNRRFLELETILDLLSLVLPLHCLQTADASRQRDFGTPTRPGEGTGPNLETRLARTEGRKSRIILESGTTSSPLVASFRQTPLREIETRRQGHKSKQESIAEETPRQ